MSVFWLGRLAKGLTKRAGKMQEPVLCDGEESQAQVGCLAPSCKKIGCKTPAFEQICCLPRPAAPTRWE